MTYLSERFCFHILKNMAQNNKIKLARVGASCEPQNVWMGALVALKLFDTSEKYSNTSSFRQHSCINLWVDIRERIENNYHILDNETFEV